MHGQFTWYELTTPDVAAAKQFYPKLTNWGVQAFDHDYTMFTSGAPVAGIYQLSAEMAQQGVPPNWMAYVAVDDVDAAIAKATSLGGAVMHGPMEVPGTGRFAVMRDPQGAVFGIYRASGRSMTWDGNPVLGRPSWHELMTTDRTAALAFYGALLGWQPTGEMDMGGGAMYGMFGQGEAMYGGIYDRMPGMEGMSPFWLLYFHVKDVAKACAAALKAGGQVIRPRMQIPGGTVAILSDPQGAAFAVHDAQQMPAAAVPAPSAPAAKKQAPAKKAAPRKAAKKQVAAKKAAPRKAAVKKAAAKKKAARKSPKRAARPAKQKPGARKVAATKKRSTAARRPAKKKAATRGRVRRTAVKRRTSAGRSAKRAKGKRR